MSTRTTPQPKVDLDATRARLERVGLGRAADQLDALIADAVKADVSPHAFLDRLLDEELGFREDRRMRTSLRLSGLPTGQTIGNFDFSFQPSIERSRIETLATCQWIRENRTLLIQGPPGVGRRSPGDRSGREGCGERFRRGLPPARGTDRDDAP